MGRPRGPSRGYRRWQWRRRQLCLGPEPASGSTGARAFDLGVNDRRLQRTLRPRSAAPQGGDDRIATRVPGRRSIAVMRLPAADVLKSADDVADSLTRMAKAMAEDRKPPPPR